MKQAEEQWMAICIRICMHGQPYLYLYLNLCIFCQPPSNGLFGRLPPFPVAARVWHLYGFLHCSSLCIYYFFLFFWFSDTIDGGKPLFMAVMECNRATGTIQNAAHILPLPDELWLNCDVSVGGWGGWPTNHTTCLTVLQIAVPLLATDRGIPFISVSKVSCLSKDKYSKIHLHRR